ncbi:MAG: toxin-antitoxin system HicB family antitoxin [Thermoguttaceae bacterium]
MTREAVPNKGVVEMPASRKIYDAAHERFVQGMPWAVFFREILGRNGMVRQSFPLREERVKFERTETYAKIQQMLTKLREQQTSKILAREAKKAKKAQKAQAENGEEAIESGEVQVEKKVPAEPTKVITVRLPRSLHEALQIEAHEHETTVNQLCISKLMQCIERELVPSEQNEEENE